MCGYSDGCMKLSWLYFKDNQIWVISRRENAVAKHLKDSSMYNLVYPWGS